MLLALLDHVVVGHDQAGMAVDHHARADRLDLALDRPEGMSKNWRKKGSLNNGSAPSPPCR
jgi:hypothetical protein